MHLKAAWLNGEIVNHESPHLNIDDHGLVVGDGVFETLLVVSDPDFVASDRGLSPQPDAYSDLQAGSVAGGRQAFAMRRHLERLRDSAAVLGIECPCSDTDLRNAVDACLAKAPDAGLVRITVTSGSGPLGSLRGGGTETVMVTVGGEQPHHESGTRVVVVPFPRNELGALAGVKSISYAENVIALQIATTKGATEAVFGDTQGRLSEGTGSNIFWVEGTTICTPPLDTGCLAGVTRGLLMELLEVTEKHLRLDALSTVNEAFLTSTTRVVQSIGSVGGVTLPMVDGPVTVKARDALLDLIATDIDP